MNQTPDKQTLRRQAMAARAALSVGQREEKSARICRHLQTHLAGGATGVLLVYRAMATEVQTESLFTIPDYRIYAPVTHHHEHMEWWATDADTTWVRGMFGILEPTTGTLWRNEPATVLIMPLTAFDRQGNRLGMGKGCFDYWLAGHRASLSQIIGLAYSVQEFAQIPFERHDVPLDYVITEDGVIPCRTS